MTIDITPVQDAMDTWIRAAWNTFVLWLDRPSSWVILFGIPILFCLAMHILTTRRFWHNTFHDTRFVDSCPHCWAIHQRAVNCWVWT